MSGDCKRYVNGMSTTVQDFFYYAGVTDQAHGERNRRSRPLPANATAREVSPPPDSHPCAGCRTHSFVWNVSKCSTTEIRYQQEPHRDSVLACA